MLGGEFNGGAIFFVIDDADGYEGVKELLFSDILDELFERIKRSRINLENCGKGLFLDVVNKNH